MAASNRGVSVVTIDVDVAARDSLAALLQSAGLTAKMYGTAEAFLEAVCAGRRGCLVLDAHFSTDAAREIIDKLSGRDIPVILITGHRTAAMKSLARRAGVVALLEKPFDDELLLDAIKRVFGSRP